MSYTCTSRIDRLEEVKRERDAAIEESAALRARVARLEEALREIRDYDTYKHPDESVIAERTKAILDSESCSECQHIKKAGWPPSGLCNTHYRTVARAQDKVAQMFEYKQTWEPREIACRALEEKRANTNSTPCATASTTKADCTCLTGRTRWRGLRRSCT